MLKGCAERSDGGVGTGGAGAGGGTIRSFDFDFDDLEFELLLLLLLLFNDERNEEGIGVELGEDEIDFEGDGL